jgi:hypothetical protein
LLVGGDALRLLWRWLIRGEYLCARRPVNHPDSDSRKRIHGV